MVGAKCTPPTAGVAEEIKKGLALRFSHRIGRDNPIRRSNDLKIKGTTSSNSVNVSCDIDPGSVIELKSGLPLNSNTLKREKRVSHNLITDLSPFRIRSRCNLGINLGRPPRDRATPHPRGKLSLALCPPIDCWVSTKHAFK